MNSVVFLDIKKAFDTVDHHILSNKLRCYGIYDEERKFSKSYLDSRAQCCQVMVSGQGRLVNYKTNLLWSASALNIRPTPIYYLHE